MLKLLNILLFISFTLQAKVQTIEFSLATTELPPFVIVNENK